MGQQGGGRLGADLLAEFPEKGGPVAAQPSLHAGFRRSLSRSLNCATGCCTIGDALIKGNQKIFASRYKLHVPIVAELRRELAGVVDVEGVRERSDVSDRRLAVTASQVQIASHQ